MRRERRRLLSARTICTVACVVTACGSPDGPLVHLTVPVGASLREVADTLVQRSLIERPVMFRAYARLKGADDDIKAGSYAIRQGASWNTMLEMLVGGHVAAATITIPEGWTIETIASRVAPRFGVTAATVRDRLLDPRLADSLGAPGPTLEGYLFPATYVLPDSVSLEKFAGMLYQRYRQVWTSTRVGRLEALGMTEREVVTLASIIQAEVVHTDEMRTISAVFHNRLRQGMRLQADPTVKYALPSGVRMRYTHIDSLADHPYNTYTHDGLPPGPIGAPGTDAIDAALDPAEEAYLYFVATGDGRHVFTSTFREHREAIVRMDAR